eukprot:TRINITY_DN4481_c0_g1_i1.p1 TRINITY_DN4481_c0_g1~~TRINITY_DN4481_c0_g1_i1.p1  ORF type:complete len:544 (+),score=140.23 TRINITY_DN4481_c0_g1_i1:212-1633(+)
MRVHMLENCSKCLNFLTKEEKITLVNMGGDDIVDCNKKIILGLIWTLILRYQINKGQEAGGSAKNELLEWVRSKIPEYNITNFTTDWNDGKALCALANAVGGDPPLCADHRSLPNDPMGNARRGLEISEKGLGIPPLVSAEDMTNPALDELSMMTYISQFRDAKRLLGERPPEAGGPGIQPHNTDNIAGHECRFWVNRNDAKGPVEVRVEGPNHLQQPPPKVTDDNGDGTYAVVYTPTVPGDYLVHVTVGGKPVEGSAFPVHVSADAGNAVCSGEGLEGGRANVPTNFQVDTSKCVGGGEIKVWIDGPEGADPAEVKVIRKDAGHWEVDYTPKAPGLYLINVTLDGIHVPGSVFCVSIQGGPSLGGEGKLRVYFSTTTSNAKTRKDQNALQKLLESREVHLRPDWEPWVPVDIGMDKELRDLIFQKAGTKIMPMLFIDDNYVGGYAEIVKMEQEGKFYGLLAFADRKKLGLAK